MSEQEGFNRGDIIFRVPAPVVEQAPPVPAPPPVSAFTLDDVPRDDRQRAAWTTWQQSMAAAFAQVRTMMPIRRPACRPDAPPGRSSWTPSTPTTRWTTDDEAMRATAMAAVQRLATGSAPTGTPPTRPAPAPAAPAQPPSAGATQPQPVPANDPAAVQDRYGRWIGRWTRTDTAGVHYLLDVGWKQIVISRRTNRWLGTRRSCG